MSHTEDPNEIQTAAVSLTIVDYVTGGEAVNAEDFGIPSFTNGCFGIIPPSQNSLGVHLFPMVIGTTIKLFQLVSGVLTQIPTTPGLNAVLVGFMFG